MSRQTLTLIILLILMTATIIVAAIIGGKSTKESCDFYGGLPASSVPVRCLEHFGVTTVIGK